MLLKACNSCKHPNWKALTNLTLSLNSQQNLHEKKLDQTRNNQKSQHQVKLGFGQTIWFWNQVAFMLALRFQQRPNPYQKQSKVLENSYLTQPKKLVPNHAIPLEGPK